MDKGIYSTVTNLLESTPIPYLTFILRIVSHEFVHRKELSNSHQKLHNTISELKEQGLGYRKISKELNRLGIKSKEGKDFYPTLVSGIWKKIVKKQRILNQPITSEYKDFDIQFFLRNE